MQQPLSHFLPPPTPSSIMPKHTTAKTHSLLSDSIYDRTDEEAVYDEDEEDVFKGYNGHTMRRYPYILSSEKEVQIQRVDAVVRVDPISNSTEIPITEIDSMFDAGFWKLPRCSYGSAHARALNTPERWENLQNKLEELAIKVVYEFEHYSNRIVAHYHVPVTGHYLIENLKDSDLDICYPAERKKKQRAPKNFLHYNGKFYDPLYIYELVDEHSDKAYLKVVCPAHVSNYLDYEITPTEDIRSSVKNRPELIGKGNFSEMANNSTKKSRNSSHKREYLQLDLNEVCDITQIGSLGGFPSQIQHFPPLPERTREDYTRRAGRPKNINRNYVTIVKNPRTLSWVTSYTIEYRDIHSGKWMKHGDVYGGNHDVGTEIKNDINLRAQHIRIYPQEFQHSREMRVRLYGNKLSNLEQLQMMKKHGMKETTRGKSKIETVEYTISPRIDSIFRVDGNGYRKNSYYYEGIATRNNRKNSYRKDIKEDIHAM